MFRKYKKVCFKSIKKSMIQKYKKVLSTKKVQRIEKYKKSSVIYKSTKKVDKKYTYSLV